MIILVAIIIFFISCVIEAYGADWEATQRYEQERHEELIETLNRKESFNKQQRVIHRRIYKDKEGNTVAEEIIEEV